MYKHNLNKNLDINRTIYFSGIGGISMSSLANILLDKGYRVKGSDIQKSEITNQLESRGVNIIYEQRKENIKDNYIIIKTDAVSDQNEEIQSAKNKDIKIIPRAELLDFLSKDNSKSIAISGTHGKTTTTSMLSYIMIKCGYDPTCLVGGIVPSWGSNYRIGNGEFFVYEACEAFYNFKYYTPDYLIITSIDEDHLEFFDNIQNIKQYFLKFINKVAKNGLVILNKDDEIIQEISNDIKGNVKYYSIYYKTNKDKRDIHFLINDIIEKYENNRIFSEFEVIIDNNHMKIELPLFGNFNIQNALAAISMLYSLSHTKTILDCIREVFPDFQNAKRRFEYLGDYHGAKIYSDYSHHPKEISCLLSMVKKISKLRHSRIIAIFQPHLYSRTKNFYKDFAKSLSLANKVILTPIYPAREEPIEGVSSKLIYRELSNHMSIDDIILSDDFSNVISKLNDIIQKDDIVITIGAGNIDYISRELLIN